MVSGHKKSGLRNVTKKTAKNSQNITKMTYFLGIQSRKIQFLGTLIKKILLYARIHALNMKGAPGWHVGAQKTTKKMSCFLGIQ